MKNDRNTKLSKTLSHALRHAPDEYGITLDENGWTDLNELVEKFKELQGYSHISINDILNAVQGSGKKRHEIKANRIRAIYGHSTAKKILKAKSKKPPAVLYHGTSPEAWEEIQKMGLKPMARQYVHLSEGPEEAIHVGSRKSKSPIVLKINTKEAMAAGVVFFKESNGIWLSTVIPEECVHSRPI